MKKTTLNTALLLLLSLGVVACGSKQNETVINSAPNTSAAELAALQEKLNEAEQALAQTNDNSSLQTQLNTEQTNLKDAEEKVAKLESTIKANEAKEKVWADKIAADLTAGGFGKQATSHTYAYLNDEEKRNELLTAITNSSGSCNSATSQATCTNKDVEAGTILFTKSNQNSAYAVVREAFDTKSDGNTPKNSYIAIVKTPTTDKAHVLGASYTGAATVSWAAARSGVSMMGENIAATADKINVVTFNVDDNGKIRGSIWNKAAANNHYQTVEFKETDVLVGSNGVFFAGDAVINDKMRKNGEGLSGTYQGAFAGSQGQEVVGTFSSDSRQDNYIHGAFSATKDSVE